MQRQITTNISVVSVFAVAISGLCAVEALAGGSDCTTGSVVEVCVEWSQGDDPVEGSDYFVTFTDPSNPKVQLKRADPAWVVYATLVSNGNPANIGTLSLKDPTPAGEDFEVTIADGAGPGAVNVKSINLNATGFTGSSSIEGGSISGNLTGALTGGLTVVQDAGGNGGELTFTIDGDVSGAITAPVVKDLTIRGGLSANLTVSDTIDCGGSIAVGGIVDAASNIVIADMCNATIDFDSGVLGRTFEGDLTLENGVPSGTTVTFNGPISAGVTIDLKTGGVAGTFKCLRSSSATILNGGLVSWQVVLASGSGNGFSGTAEFASMSGGGTIRTSDFADLDGSISVPGGMTGISDISIQGDLTSNGSITVGGTIGLSGSVAVDGDATGGDITINKMEGAYLFMGPVPSAQTLVSIGDMVSSGANPSTVSFVADFAGTLELDSGIKAEQVVVIHGELLSSGTIDLNGQDIVGTLTLEDGGAGTISNGGAVAGLVYLVDGSANSYSGTATFDSVTLGNIRTVNGGILSGVLTITNDLANECVFTGLVSGDIIVEGNLTSAIDLSDDLSGDIQIGTDVTSNGDIRVGGRLTGTGRILIDGLCDGDIKIHDETAALSQIVLSGGLDDSGSIEINTDGGRFDANGTIHVGPETLFGAPDVLFDGCIRIHDDGQGGGDLRGTIVVVGCHNVGDLNICLDGGDGGENIDIKQTGCTNHVDWSCGTCP